MRKIRTEAKLVCVVGTKCLIRFQCGFCVLLRAFLCTIAVISKPALPCEQGTSAIQNIPRVVHDKELISVKFFRRFYCEILPMGTIYGKYGTELWVHVLGIELGTLDHMNRDWGFLEL